MFLHENKNDFRVMIAATSRKYGLTRAMVEKDYYVTLFLKKLNEKLDYLLFKGGTSLSKCYDIIDRFSEDIDITTTKEVATEGVRKSYKRVIKEICEELNLPLLNEADTRSRRAFNRYQIDYNPAYKSVSIKPYLYVETAFMVKTYPYETKSIISLIGKYMKENKLEEQVKKYELDEYEIKVQKLERTIIDKVFAICDYYLKGSETGQARHIYDIYKILPYITLDDEFISLYHQVRKDRAESKTSSCLSANIEYDINALLNEIIEKETFKQSYNATTIYLLFDHTPYEEAIRGVKSLVESGVFTK